MESISGIRPPLKDPPPGKGDIALPIGFLLSRKYKKPPEMLSEEFAHSLELSFVERAVPEGGYVNIFFDRDKFLHLIWKDTISSFFGSDREGRTYVIDYSSPNIAKPMHVGHLRSTVIGESLKRILSHLGNKVIGLNYLGDIGTQFGSLLVAYKRWVDKKRLEEEPIRELFRIYVKFHEEVEKDPSLEEEARKELELLESGDKERVELWKRFKELSIKGFERIYNRLGVSFDVVVGESDFVERAKTLSRELLERGIAFIGEEGDKKGAILANLEDEGLDHPVLLKSDGTTIYLSRDLASLLWRAEQFNPDVLLYVVALEQNLHFKQLFSLARKLGIEKELVHVSFGMVHVEGMRLSTRKGQVLFLEDVLDKAVSMVGEEMKQRGTFSPNDAEKIGVSALTFWMLKTENNKDVTFRWKDLTSFGGESGPYIQYSYVRAKNILSKTESSMNPFTPTDEEWNLIKLFPFFEISIRESARRYSPHILARYLLQLSTQFHHFYDHNRVIGDRREPLRLWMVKSVENILKIGQHLLVMKPPERM